MYFAGSKGATNQNYDRNHGKILRKTTFQRFALENGQCVDGKTTEGFWDDQLCKEVVNRPQTPRQQSTEHTWVDTVPDAQFRRYEYKIEEHCSVNSSRITDSFRVGMRVIANKCQLNLHASAAKIDLH